MYDWWYSDGGKRHGPITEEMLSGLLRDGSVNENTLVWREGSREWGALSKERDLQYLLVKYPPPLPTNAHVVVVWLRQLSERIYSAPLLIGVWQWGAFLAWVGSLRFARRHAFVAALFGLTAIAILEARKSRHSQLIAILAAYFGWVGATTSYRHGWWVLSLYLAIVAAFGTAIVLKGGRRTGASIAVVAGFLALGQIWVLSQCWESIRCTEFSSFDYGDSFVRLHLLLGISFAAYRVSVRS